MQRKFAIIVYDRVACVRTTLKTFLFLLRIVLADILLTAETLNNRL